MSGRDLLYKPQVPILQPEEQSDSAKVQKGKKTREIGEVNDGGVQRRSPVEGRRPEPMGSTSSGSQSLTSPAYKAAYFNQDTSGVRAANLRSRPAAALRGDNAASDLRKVVLPPAVGVETPDPVQLRAATDLMALDGSFELNLSSLIARQKAWARAPGVTVEHLRARLAQLASMVDARRQALLRMRQGRAAARTHSVTLDWAEAVDGKGMGLVKDLHSESQELIERTGYQAEGMHQRLAKMLGLRRPK